MRQFGTGLRILVATAWLAGAGVMSSQPVFAQRPAAGQVMSRERVVELAERRYKAKVVRADLGEGEGGRRVYQLRLLSEQGRLWTVRVDAVTGDPL
jgi:uncharacterized membrane protein YkoI